mgnify:CR=1 FL=1
MRRRWAIAEDKGRVCQTQPAVSSLALFPSSPMLSTTQAAIWARIGNTANASLLHLESANPRILRDLQPIASLPVCALPLHYPLDGILEDLSNAGCNPDTAAILAASFSRAVSAISRLSQDAFESTVRGIAPTFAGSADAESHMQQVMASKHARDFRTALDQVRRSMLAEVEAHRTRMATATTNERGVFSDEATTILLAVYERQTNVSRREKQALSERTGLSLAQIATWVRRSLCSRSPSLTHRAVFQPPRSPRTVPPQRSPFRPPLPQRSPQRRRRRTPSILHPHLLPFLQHLDRIGRLARTLGRLL